MVDLNKGATVELVKALSDDIRTLPDNTKALSAGEAVRGVYGKLHKELIAVNSWQAVQKIVRDGIAKYVFSIGDQFTCLRGGINLVWDIIGIDHDTPADPQFTHSLTLQLHDCFTTAIQIDAPEAFYYAENGLEAGTYNFKIDNTDYQFTLVNAVPAGGQLILNWSSNTPTSISVSPTKGGEISGSSVEVTAGSDGTALSTNHLNDINRTKYGSNNYKESAIRQWLSSSAAAGSVWTPQSNFDRPPVWAATTAGFMNGLDNDFLAVVGDTTITVAKNTVTDGGSSETLNDKFFLPSRSEIYGGLENNVSEGNPYPYYADNSDLSSPGIGNDSNRIKLRSDAAKSWLSRTPVVSSSYRAYYINAYGYITGGNANATSAYVVPVCNII